MKLGLVTCEAYPLLPDNEQFMLKELPKVGIQAFPVVWSGQQDWKNFDALLIRSVWDYHKRHQEFIDWLNHIKSAGIPTQNSVDLVLNNVDKTYLKQLEKQGVSIVPTEILTETSIDEIEKKMNQHNWNQAVLKPTISATAYHTSLIDQTIKLEQLEIRPDLSYLLQPFIPEIEHGEHSLVFFNGKFSHAVIKKPKPNDFRVQSDFGGSFSLTEVSANVIDQAKQIIATLKEIPLYARVDGVIIDDQFMLMELELIEPELFLLNPELRNGFIQTVRKAFQSL